MTNNKSKRLEYNKMKDETEQEDMSYTRKEKEVLEMLFILKYKQNDVFSEQFLFDLNEFSKDLY